MYKKYKKIRSVEDMAEDLKEGTEVINDGLIGEKTRKRYKKRKYSF